MPAKPLSEKHPAGKIWVHLFIRWAGALLLALALVNLIQAGTSGPSLIVLDPLLGIPLRLAVLAVGGLELVVALICLFGRQAGLQSGLIAWLATNFAVYRAGLLWQGCHTQWGCLGNPLDRLRLLPSLADHGLYFLLACLLLGGYAALVWLWFGEPASVRNWKERIEGLKMSCPACGVHIKFALQYLGQKIPCPHCRANITLRKPDRLKMSCYFCQEHIEFPTHAIGEKMPCPHCKMDITLKEPA
jgi:hypothetical protein